MILKPSANTHFYESDGTPAYNVSISEARKRGLRVSVTQAQKVAARVGLDLWKIEEHMKMMYQLLAGKSADVPTEEEAIKAAREMFNAAGDERTQRGGDLHDMLESAMHGHEVHVPEEYTDMWKPVQAWIDQYEPRAIWAEKPVVGRGYAGRLDFYGEIAGIDMLGDFKTQWVKEFRRQKPRTGDWEFFGEPRIYGRVYEEWIEQLAAYRNALLEMKLIDELSPMFSLIISTNPECPGVAMYRWNAEEIAKGWERFTAKLRLWQLMNDWEEPR